MSARCWAATLAVVALVTGCTPDGADEESGAGAAGDSLTPTYPPVMARDDAPDHDQPVDHPS